MFIDDERFPISGDSDMVIARTPSAALAFMNFFGCPAFISFDHDLGLCTKTNQEMSAMEVVHFMIDRDLDTNQGFIPKDFTFYVHSQNPIGRENITGLLNSYLSRRSSL